MVADTQGMIDQDFVLAIAQGLHESKPARLGEQCGTILQRGDDGKAQYNANDAALPVTCVLEYRPYRVARQLMRAGVPFIDNTMVIDIVRAADGHVAGAVGIDLKSGDAHLFRAKTVIMATGGYHWASGITAGSPESTGQGQAIYMRHGLSLKDMEFFAVDFETIRPYGTMAKEKDQVEIAGFAAINANAGMFARNKSGKFFTEGLASSDVDNTDSFQAVIITAAKEIIHGNGTPGDGSNNGLYLDLDRVTAVSHMLPAYYYSGYLRDSEWGLGYQQPKDVEMLCDYYSSGGWPSTKPGTCETEITGLYSATMTVSEWGTTFAAGQGYLAGKDAVQKAKSMDFPGFAETDVQDILNKAFGMLEAAPSDPVRPIDIHRNMQRAFYKGMNLIREEQGMQATLDELLRIQEEDLPRMNVPVKSKQFNVDWRMAMEAEGMLLCLIGTTQAALYRKETRPFHIRTDYPVMDNANWLVHVWVKLNGDGTWSIDTTPVNDSIIPAAQINEMLPPVDMSVPNTYKTQ